MTSFMTPSGLETVTLAKSKRIVFFSSTFFDSDIIFLLNNYTLMDVKYKEITEIKDCMIIHYIELRINNNLMNMRLG